MPSSILSITFDCARPSRLAAFWAEALGYAIRPYDAAEVARLRTMGIEDVADDPTVAVDPPAPGAPSLFFVKVPESKAAKNRVHLDLRPPDTMDAEVERLIGLGARRMASFQEDHGRWTTLLDPEGNELCIMAPDQ